MFTQPVQPPAAAPQPSNTVSPSRSSRLRGLSYLRNYTQNHILSRDPSNTGAATSSSTPGTNNISTATGAATASRQSAGLTRSVSYTPGALTNPQPASTSTNRLSLVSSTPENRTARQTATSNSISESATHSQLPQQTNGTTTASNNDPAAATTSAAAAAAPAAMPTSAADGASSAAGSSSTPESAPSIRFSSYFDQRASRPSLNFSPITRTLPTGTEVIRVGRYSERDSQPLSSVSGNQPSAANVGFKSKVVSRRHCEFWHEDGKWYVKDVKSSSGTFLNHIRLSPPSQESKAFVVNDGDIIQLGIDFKGGEEMIFRCVKMRLELNRGWQNKPNTFNVAAHKRLRTMASANAAAGEASSSVSTQDCVICLNSIAPCQSLFVAPCSHTWHFKCVKALLMGPQYPIFICPNCRAGADLEADVEEPEEEWEMFDEQEKEDKLGPIAEGEASPAPAEASSSDPEVADPDRMDITISEPTDTPEPSNPTAHATSAPLPIRNASATRRSTPSPPRPGAEGPITPRNDVGPWVLDGRAGRDAPHGVQMSSLDAAATEMDLTIHVGDHSAQ
ncbi:FHA domain containing protein [Cordyceps fumosorosea ARSEF 2679]|uniref:RING-type E3 ubiquitin transferase n=1 Tax=Cordyceps fumosorosea (strain ARSEF 2679) TaxID=1081104 RepID=A0A168CLQ0_CORFA|nr:FHA domain containing protein [Cordyceps fumosorosea ARSEF 2679]OAA71531.1 FHA domain containing protein [Cordyceps fumosorosea ARSEF 2679]